MTEVKHTPGPWLTQWEHDGDESIWSRDGGMHMIATCHAEDDRVIPAKANARLIAAAPNLFEALRALATECSQVWSADEFPALKAAFAALSKATTQQEGR